MEFYGTLDEWATGFQEHDCEACDDKDYALYHTSDHLMGLQLAMISGKQDDVRFHLEEMCGATNTKFLFEEEDNG